MLLDRSHSSPRLALLSRPPLHSLSQSVQLEVHHHPQQAIDDAFPAGSPGACRLASAPCGSQAGLQAACRV